jgi:hypothetical protein
MFLDSRGEALKLLLFVLFAPSGAQVNRKTLPHFHFSFFNITDSQ